MKCGSLRPKTSVFSEVITILTSNFLAKLHRIEVGQKSGNFLKSGFTEGIEGSLEKKTPQFLRGKTFQGPSEITHFFVFGWVLPRPTHSFRSLETTGSAGGTFTLRTTRGS